MIARFLAWLRSPRQSKPPAGNPFLGTDRLQGVRPLDAADEREYRAEVNGAAAARRAEAAAVFSALLNDRPPWLGYRRGWLDPRKGRHEAVAVVPDAHRRFRP